MVSLNVCQALFCEDCPFEICPFEEYEKNVLDYNEAERSKHIADYYEHFGEQP
jgi:hypothetical protein